MAEGIDNATNVNCQACGNVLEPERVLYDGNGNKLCWGCYRMLHATEIRPRPAVAPIQPHPMPRRRPPWVWPFEGWDQTWV